MRQVEDLMHQTHEAQKNHSYNLHTQVCFQGKRWSFFIQRLKKTVRNDGFYLFDRGRDYCNTIGKHINTIFAFALLARVNVRTHIT